MLRQLIRNAVGGLLLLSAGTELAVAFLDGSQERCEAHLDGGQFPFLIPEYRVWQEIFSRVDGTQTPYTTTLQLTEPGMRSLQAIAKDALRRFATLQDASSRPGAVSGAAADVLLDARDDLLRMLSADEAEILLKHADSVRQQTRYTFPVPGSRVTVQDTPITCPISIAGRQHPALIPEAYYWEFHFRSLASIAEERRVGQASYAADFLLALRQQHLPIPERDVIALLTTAVETIPKADAARAKYTDSRLAERAVAAIVRAARLRLLRTVPRESWIVIQRDAARARGGTTYDFPTTN